MVGAGHHRAAAGLRHAAATASESVATATAPDAGLLGAAQHMHDHRLAGDLGQRLAGQPARRHAGRNEDQDFTVGHETWVRGV